MPLFKMRDKWHPREFGIESVAFSKLYITVLEKESKLRNTWFGATPLKVSTQRSKDSRIRDTVQQVATEGRLYVNRNMMDFITEFVDFPQGRTKDILDAFTHCITLMRTPMSVEEEEAEAEYEEMINNARSEITGY